MVVSVGIYVCQKVKRKAWEKQILNLRQWLP